MKTIWLINPYGPIPTEKWRTYCYTLIGERLAEAGYNVVWWTSNFSHHFKKKRSNGWRDLKISERFTIRLVPTNSYKKNIGVGRLIRDYIFAFKTYFRGKKCSPPNCIIHSESPLTLGYAGHRLAKFFDVPSINHQMDLWPELIVNSCPLLLRPFLNIALLPIFMTRKIIYNELSATTALASPYLDAAFKIAPRLKLCPNRVIYNGIDISQFRSWMNIDKPSPAFVRDSNRLRVIFAGTLGPSYDIRTLCLAAQHFFKFKIPVQIIIAGSGPYKKLVLNTQKFCGKDYLDYIGQVSAQELAKYYCFSDVGVCAYSSKSNVEMPDKIYDYTAAGLAVLVSLRGEVSEICVKNMIGLSYIAGNYLDLVDKILLIEADRAQLNNMKQNSFKLGNFFDTNVQYTKFLEVLAEVEVI